MRLTLYQDEIFMALSDEAYCVRVFQPTGRFLRQMGRKGKGDGEFMFPTAIQIHSYGSDGGDGGDGERLEHNKHPPHPPQER